MADSEVIALLRDLIRLDTSNPPGNEMAAVELLAAKLKAEGVPYEVVEPAPGRGNIVARLKGDGTRRPLLLSAHLDVVPAVDPGWKHPPFAAELHDGYVWGRGAVDMKHMAAMSLVVLLELKRKGVRLSRDLIFAGVADEEAGGVHGAGHLVDHRRELVDAEFCLTELGGMSVPMNGRVLVPVQTGQKGYVWFTLKAKGQAGHGSRPKRGGAVEKLADAVRRLCREPLSYRLTDTAAGFLDAVSSAQGPVKGTLLKLLKHGATAEAALSLVPGERQAVFRAMLHNTVSVTGLSAGAKVNVIPGSACAHADGRYLPGVTQEEFLAEVSRVVGPDIEVSVFDAAPPLEIDHRGECWEAIERVMTRHLPGAAVTPYLIPGMTDAKDYARAGIKTYGFAPVALKEDEPFADLYHAPNERVSVEGVEKGLVWLRDVVLELCEARP